jgi:ATP-binding cassette subfamily A (ABC1) protein 3
MQEELKAVLSDIPVITKDKLKACCERLGRADFAEEVSEHGSGVALWQQLETDRSIDILSFIEWFLIESHGAQVFTWLRSSFPSVSLIEHYLTFYKFKLEKEGTGSLGFLFGRIEEAKGRLRVSEYSLSQTTLEQIFNMFATQTYETERLANRLSGGETAVQQ